MATCKDFSTLPLVNPVEEEFEYINRDGDDDGRPPPNFTAYSNYAREGKTGNTVNQYMVAERGSTAYQIGVVGDLKLHFGPSYTATNCKFNKNKTKPKKEKKKEPEKTQKHADVIIPDEILNSTAEVTDENMQIVKANSYSLDLELLAVYLGLPEAIVDDVKDEKPNSTDQDLAFFLLEKWRSFDHSCRVGKLAKALKESGAAHIALKLGSSSLIPYTRRD